MSLFHARHNIPVETQLHPAVYGGLAGCLIWLVASAWLAFGADGYTALQLAVSTGFAIMFMLVPFCLWMLWQQDNTPKKASPLREWADHELMTASGPVEGKHAAIMVLLAPAAVALGLSAVALI